MKNELINKYYSLKLSHLNVSCLEFGHRKISSQQFGLCPWITFKTIWLESSLSAAQWDTTFKTYTFTPKPKDTGDAEEDPAGITVIY